MSDSSFFAVNPKAPMAVRAQGVYIYDKAGKRYLDGSGGAMTVSLGHSNTEILEAMKQQMDRMTFTYRSQFTSEPLEDLCRRLAEKFPGGPGGRVSLANSGSEATELALKLAYSYWRAKGRPEKQRVISRWSSYHGSTAGSLSMSGNAGRRKEYVPYLSDWPSLELPICSHCPFGMAHPDCGLFCADQLERLINRIGKDNISAAIFEPITGASGAGITPPDGYFQRIQDICRSNEILLIMDEIITGIGRTGKFFASEHWGIVPDILCFGKGIASGYAPLSGIIASQLISSTLEESGVLFSTGHTFSGNPLSAAAANAVLDFMEQHDLVALVEQKGAVYKEKLLALKNRYSSIIGEIRGKGLLWGIELWDVSSRRFFDPSQQVTATLVDLCFENGLNLYPSTGYIDGRLGDSILISPPFTISDAETEELFEILDRSVEALRRRFSLG